MKKLPLALLLAVLVACSGDNTNATDDDGAADTGTQDTGMDDSGSSDTGADATADTGDDSDEDTVPEREPPTGYPADPLADGGFGGDRPAAVTLPSDYSPDRWYPVVVMLHGYTANGTLQDFVFQLSRRVDAYDFIFVVPEGTVDQGGDQFWNANERCCDFYGSGVDDSSYLRSLVEEVQERIPVDDSRVIFWGHSNGAYMSYRMACDHSDLVTHVYGLAGVEPFDASVCADAEPVTVLHVHGTLDDSVPYSSGPGILGAVENSERWAERNGCFMPHTPQDDIDLDAAIDGAETTVDLWDDCDRGVEVQLWTIEAGLHVPDFGSTKQGTDWALDFLLSHPRTP